MLKSQATNSRSNFLKSAKAHAQEMKSARFDILSMIKDQHDVLRESIQVLKDPEAAVHLKQKHLAQFIPYLKMHSEAEEQTIYSTLKEIDDAQTATIEAYTEHSLAKSLVSELETKDYSRVWTNEIEAKAKVLAELVEHHADEEEEQFFEKARQNLAKIELKALGEEFYLRCQEYQVRESKQIQSGRQRDHGNRGVSRTH